MTNYYADRGFGADPKRANGKMRKIVRDCLRERCVALCVTNSDVCLACRTTCHDSPTGTDGGSCPAVRYSPLERFRAQTGSILVKRGGHAASFFADRAKRYVEMWRLRRRRLRNNSVGTDQVTRGVPSLCVCLTALGGGAAHRRSHRRPATCDSRDRVERRARGPGRLVGCPRTGTFDLLTHMQSRYRAPCDCCTTTRLGINSRRGTASRWGVPRVNASMTWPTAPAGA